MTWAFNATLPVKLLTILGPWLEVLEPPKLYPYATWLDLYSNLWFCEVACRSSVNSSATILYISIFQEIDRNIKYHSHKYHSIKIELNISSM